MKLARADLATVPERKITHYLLNPAHPAGGSKAVFFLRFGYAASHWRILAADILRHACENEIATVEDVPYGKRYVVDGLLTAPDGTRSPSLGSVPAVSQFLWAQEICLHGAGCREREPERSEDSRPDCLASIAGISGVSPRSLTIFHQIIRNGIPEERPCVSNALE